MDPHHSNTRHFTRVVGEIWADYVRTHTLEECEELNRRVMRNRQDRRRLFGAPRAVERPPPWGGGRFCVRSARAVQAERDPD